ncbi:unnamed protein product [Didymodactylos carnosus]|uniref:protein-tyrosine-phosphatase n=1 Tax=Didymodactylos carnosus TaxID=1234261 RepID=A0A813VZA7_9BILA|nr:unnamed protein product [Didymodactylos carnosus]CAF3637852.1 unnamed protein product [Didymodactylos carnosus]
MASCIAENVPQYDHFHSSMFNTINDKTRLIHSQFEKKLLIRSSTATTLCESNIKTETLSTLRRLSTSFCHENKSVSSTTTETHIKSWKIADDKVNSITKKSRLDYLQLSKKRQLSGLNEKNNLKYIKNNNNWTRSKDDNDAPYNMCRKNKKINKKKSPCGFFLGENIAFEKPVLRNSFSHSTAQEYFDINTDEEPQFTSLPTTIVTKSSVSVPYRKPTTETAITMLLCEQPPILSSFLSVSGHYRTIPEQSTSKKVESKDQVKLLTSNQLSDYLESLSSDFVLIDCGSPFRYVEKHINKSFLLHVADKLSKKRLTTHGLSKYLDTTQMKLIDNSEFIILYDDNVTINNIKNISCPNLATTLSNSADGYQLSLSYSSLIMNDNGNDTISSSQLTPSLKCIYDELKRYNPLKSIFILDRPFNEFYCKYSHLCTEQKNIPSSESSSLEQQLNEQQLSRSDIENCLLIEIIPGLYLGNEADAKNYDLLEKNNIKSIVNVTTCVPCYFESKLDYLRLPCDDTCRQNLIEYCNEKTFQFIQNSLTNKKNVLIHCKAGISRSPAILIAYLMKYHQSEFRTMNEAYNYVKTKRSIVSPNLNFMGQLLQYEKLLTPIITKES